MAKITYVDKVTMNENPDIPAINKCQAADMNEIKTVVNENDNNAGVLSALNTTDKSSLVNAINELYDSNFYEAGDTYVAQNTINYTGYITASTAQVLFMLPLPKKLKNITGVEYNTFNVVMRGVSGYLNNASSYFSVLSSPYTIITGIGEDSLTIQITKSSAYTNVANNTPVNVQIQGGFSITFKNN